MGRGGGTEHRAGAPSQPVWSGTAVRLSSGNPFPRICRYGVRVLSDGVFPCGEVPLLQFRVH